ncbi:MAG TPA: hypothetical protein VHV47_02940, partial [Opitutaceae bacterium]|nr:hypothetical protein [Opitutaceae bacterium]
MPEPRNRRTPRLIAVILVEAVVIAVLVLALLRQHREASALAADGQRARTDAQKRISDLESHLAPRKPADAGSDLKRSNDFAHQFLRSQSDLFKWESSPEVAPLRAVVSRAEFASRSADLLRYLHLPPDKVGALGDLMIEERQEQADIQLESRAQDIKDPDAVRKLLAQSQQDLEAKIKDAIGDDSYAQLQYYRGTQAQREQVLQLQQTLSYGEAPLSDEQSEQLVKVLAASAPPLFTGFRPVAGTVATMIDGQIMTEDPTSLTDEIVSQAGS